MLIPCHLLDIHVVSTIIQNQVQARIMMKHSTWRSRVYYFIHYTWR